MSKLIELSIPEEKHAYLIKTIDLLQNTIYKLGIHELLKDSMNKDICIIKSILKTNKKEK